MIYDLNLVWFHRRQMKFYKGVEQGEHRSVKSSDIAKSKGNDKEKNVDIYVRGFT
jgi:hypothetical protein